MKNINALQERIIWLLWLGNDKMSFFRKLSLLFLKLFSGCRVILINPKTLPNYEKKDDPLHRGYYLLSLTHKSDYIRNYFMYHYGGGYSDVKGYWFNWKPYFKKLEDSKKDFIGSAEIRPERVASNNELVKNSYHKLANNVFYIYKPKSFFAKEVKLRIKKIMDRVYLQLQKQNGLYHPRAIKGGVHGPSPKDFIKNYPKNYPLKWAEINGRDTSSITI